MLDAHRLMEVQRTFYKPPQVATTQRWGDKAPDGCTFALKARRFAQRIQDSGLELG